MKEQLQEVLQEIPELSQKENIFGKVSSFFISRYKVVYLLIIAIIVIGVSSYMGLERELQPEIEFPSLSITTIYPGAGPNEMETLVTNKIESRLESLDDVEKVVSTSSFGVSNIWVKFNQGSDVDKKIQDTRDALSGVESELPNEVESPMLEKSKFGNEVIMILNLSGNYDFVKLTSIAEALETRLESESAIQDVTIVGGLEREIRINVDPQKLAIYGISIERIKRTIARSNVNFPGGDVVLDNRNYKIRTIGELKHVKELENIVLSNEDGMILRLKDVAHVVDGYKEIESYSRLYKNDGSYDEGLSQTISLSVEKKASADVIKTSALIHSIVDSEKGSLYPEDMIIEVSGDTAIYVDKQLGVVSENAVSGLLIVMIVLFMFIGFREALVVSIVIPLSIMIALWLLKINGLTFNEITTFSLVLAVGMLVDNGIVVMENIDRLRHKGLDPVTASRVGTNQVAPAIAASTLTTLAAFYPIALTPGDMGAFIKSIPLTVIYCLIASFVVAIVVAPALCSKLLKSKKQENHESKHGKLKKYGTVLFVVFLSVIAFTDRGQIGLLSIVFATLFGGIMLIKQIKKTVRIEDSKFIQKYGDMLLHTVKNKKSRRLFMGGVLLAFAMSVSLVPLGLLKIELFVEVDTNRIYVDMEAPKGTPIDATSQIAEEVEYVLLDVPEIESFVSNIGITGPTSLTSVGESSAEGSNIGRVIIDLKDKDERNRTSMEIKEDLNKMLSHISGTEITLNSYQTTPVFGDALGITIFGTSLENMEKTLDDFMEIAREIEGTRNIESSLEDGEPELQIRVNKEKASRYGLDDMSIAIAVRRAVEGLEATKYRINQEEIDVMIRTTNDKLNTKDDIEKLYFYNNQGLAIRFDQVADVIEGKGYTNIYHRDGKRMAFFTADAQEGYLASELMAEFMKGIEDYELPKGVEFENSGVSNQISESFTDMMRNMILAVLMVYIILSVQFNSLSQPFIILFTVPLGLIGVMPGLVLTGNNFGLTSFIGIVALVGIAVNDAIVLVDYINYLRSEGYDLHEAVKETGITRFIPVMATTITTAGGILPITLKTPFFAPLGYSLIFGLLAATVLTLVVIPIIYTSFEEMKLRRQSGERIRLNVKRLGFRKEDLSNEESISAVTDH